MRIIPFLAIAGVLSLASCNKTASEPVNEIENNTTTPVAETPTTTGTSENEQKGAETAVKLNPPHGEPGHRCEIAVGAPLDSQPAAVPTQQNQGATQPANGGKGFLSSGNNTTQPAQAQQVPQQQTAPGFSGKPNPAHGQPGHRCDIQVGQTLP